jgi:hypothetical protein
VDSLIGAYDEELAATAFGADVVVHDDAETAARSAAQCIIRRHKPRPMLNTVQQDLHFVLLLRIVGLRRLKCSS